MIVSELVTNAYKHAFRGREGGSVRVTLGAAPQGRACLTVVDDGLGFTGALPGSGSGVRIVASLARAIGGAFTVSGDDPHRVLAQVVFTPFATSPASPVPVSEPVKRRLQAA